MKSNLYQFQRNLGVSMQCKSTGHKMFPNEQAFTYAQAALMVKISEFCWGGYLLSKVAGNHTPQIEWDLSWFNGISDWHKDGFTTDNRINDVFMVGCVIFWLLGIVQAILCVAIALVKHHNNLSMP